MPAINQLDKPVRGPVKFVDVTFMVANVVGIISYLQLASRGWRIAEEQGEIPIAGEPFVWAFALPVLGIFVLADLVWGGLLWRRRDRRTGLWWFIVFGLWLIAIVVDFAHH